MQIYKVTDLINGKIYIGQDSKDRKNYFGSGLLICRAIKSRGKKNFIKQVIDTATCLKELNEKERYWIKFYNCKDPNGYNIMDGGQSDSRLFGDSNPSRRLEVKQKQSKITKQNWKDFGIRKLRIEQLKEACQRPETIEKKSKAMVEVWKDTVQRKNRITAIAKSLLDPIKRKNRIDGLNKKETKGKQSKASRESWANPEVRDRRIQSQIKFSRVKEIRKGKTYEEIFGEQKAKEMKEKSRRSHVGKLSGAKGKHWKRKVTKKVEN